MRVVISTLSIAMVSALVGCANLLALEDNVPYARDAAANASGGAADVGTPPVQGSEDAASADATTATPIDAAVDASSPSAFVFPACNAAPNAILCFDDFSGPDFSNNSNTGMGCTSTPSNDPSSGSILVVTGQAGSECNVHLSSLAFDGTKGFRFRVRFSAEVASGGYADVLKLTVADTNSFTGEYVIVGTTASGPPTIWWGSAKDQRQQSAPKRLGWREIDLYVDPNGPDRLYLDGVQFGSDIELPLTSSMTATIALLDKVQNASATASFDDIVMVPF